MEVIDDEETRYHLGRRAYTAFMFLFAIIVLSNTGKDFLCLSSMYQT